MVKSQAASTVRQQSAWTRGVRTKTAGERRKRREWAAPATVPGNVSPQTSRLEADQKLSRRVIWSNSALNFKSSASEPPNSPSRSNSQLPPAFFASVSMSCRRVKS